MKKNTVIIFVILITLSLTILGFVRESSTKQKPLELGNVVDNTMENKSIDKIKDRIFTDFIYDVGPRFNPITKSDLNNLTSFNDIIGEEHAQRIVDYKSVSVIIMGEEKPSDIRVNGITNEFNDSQLKFIHELDYSTNIVIWADYQEKNSNTGEIEDSHWTPYFTIIPEKQAAYINGKVDFKKYLKENSEEIRIKANVVAEELQPAKLFFTVNKNGIIENVRLDRTSNYPLVDNKMIELIKQAPGNWLPAENAKGEKVDQELVVSFGLMGC